MSAKFSRSPKICFAVTISRPHGPHLKPVLDLPKQEELNHSEFQGPPGSSGVPPLSLDSWKRRSQAYTTDATLHISFGPLVWVLGTGMPRWHAGVACGNPILADSNGGNGGLKLDWRGWVRKEKDSQCGWHCSCASLCVCALFCW